MDRRRFLALSALTPAAALAASAGVPALADAAVPVDAAAPTPGASHGRHTFGFAEDGSAFLLDGAPFQIRSGEMHPARIPVPYWQQRLRMARAMGLNTVSLYVMWNYVEPRKGHFDFRSERRDVARFVRLAQREGLWVLLRPGPYVCGEWDLGGLPSYLLADPKAQLRVGSATYPPYLAAVRRYAAALAAEIRPLMITNGGPILMVQVENEYGSFGSDQSYLREVRQAWLSNGIRGPFYTEDGLGQLEQNHTNVPGGAIALSGGDAGQIAQARAAYPQVPVMAGEVYPGWLTHWGDRTFQGGDYVIADQLTAFMQQRLSFNLYMVHGGTSFGFWAGANADNLSGDYQPDITSYDYSAPITEQGVGTPRYTQYRGIIADYVGERLPDVPPAPPTIARAGGASLTPVPYASLWDNLPTSYPTSAPQPMEYHGQSSGFVLYRKALRGYAGGTLDIRWVHDYATVFLDDAYQGGFSRPAIPDDVSTELNVTNGNAPLPLAPSSAVGTHPTLDVLVEGMGRTNYGQAIIDRKGILESVSLTGAGPLTGELTGWRTYPLPVDDAWLHGLRPTVRAPKRPGIVFRARVELTRLGDTYVDVAGWTKGVVWVNGHNLGRYWKIGPQHALFCPAQWLRHGTNEIMILDLHQTDPAPISLVRTLQ